MTQTAAGMIAVEFQATCAARGGTTIFFGRMADGRFVVTSRWQYEIRTKFREKALAKFHSLLREAA
jgi:hypothetical protein